MKTLLTYLQKTHRTQSPRPVYTKPALAKSAGRIKDIGHASNVFKRSTSYLYISSLMSGDNGEFAVGRLAGSPDTRRPETGWRQSPLLCV